MLADVLVPTVHRQRVDAVAATQAHTAERAAHHAATRRDQDLDGRGLNSRELIDAAQFLVVLQGQKLRHLGAQHHAVAHLQPHVRQVAPQRMIAAHHVDQPHTVALKQLHVQHVTPDQVGLGRDDGLGEELHLGAVREHVRHAVALRQQAVGEERHVDQTPSANDEADGKDLKNTKGLQALRPRDTVHQQVR